MRIIKLNRFIKKTLSISDIVEGCRKGDSASQEILYKQYAPAVLTVCRRYEQPYFGAKDMLQETFIAVFKNIGQYDVDRASIETWIKRIAVNTALKVLRKKGIQFVDITEKYDIPDSIEAPKEIAEVSDESILEVLNELPEGYRTVFNLHVIDGFTHKEIAELLGIAPATSKSQLSKAKAMIRKKLTIKKNKISNML